MLKTARQVVIILVLLRDQPDNVAGFSRDIFQFTLFPIVTRFAFKTKKSGISLGRAGVEFDVVANYTRVTSLEVVV